MKIHLRFGMHRDAQLIHQVSEKLDGLVIPAHILAHQPAATSVFVTSLPGKPHYIDPMTFMFQQPRGALSNEDGVLRASIRKLAEEYDANLVGALEALDQEDVLSPDDVADTDALCSEVVKLQLEIVAREASKSAAAKYLKRYDKFGLTQPRLVLPPYFKFDAVDDRWYAVAKRCAASLANYKGDVQKATLICTQSAALDAKAIKRIVKDFGQFGVAVLWIDDYHQGQIDSDAIGRVRALVTALREAQVAVEALYGGYLMLLSEFDGLAGLSHGVLYTESKSVALTPGSGGAPERYYIPAVHEFRSLSQTDLIMHKHPELLCNCEVCEENIEGDPDNLIKYADEPELLRRHFLTVRREEADATAKTKPTAVGARLRATYKKYDASFRSLPNPDAMISGTRQRGLDYLIRWADGIGG